MAKTVLMVAFHFPPFAGSSGVQRTLRFTQYLPEFDWQPVVLTANSKAHEKTLPTSEELSSNLVVKRAFALDTARHLAIKGRYFNWMAIPDRWASWIFGGIPAGLRLLKKHKPDIIWSTYPIASAHYIGWVLHRLSGLPWVADFRDPMVEQNQKTGKWAPANKLVRKARLWIEQKAVKHATRLIFCTEGAKSICMQRYPNADFRDWLVISNGFDENVFAQVEESLKRKKMKKQSHKKITLLHSGVLYYTTDRDPSCFFEALAALKTNNIISSEAVEIILRASGFDTQYQLMLEKWGITDIVKLRPAFEYKKALEEMMTVDGLLIFQGYTSNPAIPAKAYEYLRAKKPILSLVDTMGDTAKLMKKMGANFTAPLDDAPAIQVMLSSFIEAFENNSIEPLGEKEVAGFSRQKLTGKLAEVFNNVSESSKC